MSLIQKIDRHAETHPDRIAHIGQGNSQMTYAELRSASDTIAMHLMEETSYQGAFGRPILVYGHKQNDMLRCFLGSVKAGRPYIPIDSSLPAERVFNIAVDSGADIAFILEDAPQVIQLLASIPGLSVHTKSSLDSIVNNSSAQKPEAARFVQDSETYYIIYTSGSTGKPKGVQIPLSCLESFVRWGTQFLNIGSDETFLNQANFSFDLSVADLYLSLENGGTLYSIDRKQMHNPRDLFNNLQKSGVTVWVSTPSFASLCLFDEKFSHEILPNVKTFFFCGETLPVEVARALLSRFHGAKVFNTYGPTEATVAVTQVEITAAICNANSSLPVGRVKDDCTIHILDPEGQSLPQGGIGEIVISGNSVGKGYLNNKELTSKYFFEMIQKGNSTRAYRTGDAGFLMDGLLHYKGRMDFQVKVNGYRIELEDVENNICKLECIANAVVVPEIADGIVTNLVAFVVLKDTTENLGMKTALSIREGLKSFLPDYMLPKKIVVKDILPMTPNGKIDRKNLSLEARA